MTQAGLEHVAQAHALVAVDHGVDHVLPSVLQGLVEERRVVLVQDKRGSPGQQELDGGHVALSRCEVERGVLEYQDGKHALIVQHFDVSVHLRPSVWLTLCVPDTTCVETNTLMKNS